jgi:hypothetical protein
MAQDIECLSSKHEDMSSNFSSPSKKEPIKGPDIQVWYTNPFILAKMGNGWEYKIIWLCLHKHFHYRKKWEMSENK